MSWDDLGGGDYYGTSSPRRVIVGDNVPVNQFLTGGFTTGTLVGMARTDVVEFTHHFTPDSDAIAELWWNRNTKRLTVRFKTAGVYSYDEVGPSLWHDFVVAESQGKFFRDHFRESEWPGAKHNEALTKFVAVATEGAPVSIIDRGDDTDLDSLKVVRLTNSAHGGNKKFVVYYEPKLKGRTVEVRASDMDEAIDLVETYFKDKGISVSVDGVYIEVR